MKYGFFLGAALIASGLALVFAIVMTAACHTVGDSQSKVGNRMLGFFVMGFVPMFCVLAGIKFLFL